MLKIRSPVVALVLLAGGAALAGESRSATAGALASSERAVNGMAAPNQQPGTSQTGPDQAPLDQAPLNQAPLNQAPLNQTGANQTGANQAGLSPTGPNQAGPIQTAPSAALPADPRAAPGGSPRNPHRKLAATGNAVAYPPCTTEPDAQAIQAARGAFDAGKAAFEEGDYERAITYWEDAYRRDCTAHPMLKNLARAYELNDQYQRAIHALRMYVGRTPGAPDHDALQRRIENLEARQAELTAMRQAAARARAATSSPTTTTAARHEVALEPDAGAAQQGRSPWPLIVAGGGVVLAGLGTVQWLRARSDAEDAADACIGDRQNCGNRAAVERGNDAVRRERTWGIVAGVGAATLTGGVVWYLLQPRPDSAAAVAPDLGPHHAGLLWSGRF